MRRLVLAVLVCAAITGFAAPVVRADGDPASDVLYFQDVFLPYVAPSTTVAAQLTSTVAAANKAGFRIKVAVIGTAQDLGSVPSLFNQPTIYAHFLGVELRQFYTQRLLVVMPSGFGVYNNGRPTGKETAALATVKIASPDSDGLTTAATAAVVKLRATIAGNKKPPVPPTVAALRASGTKGKPVALRYRVYDKSSRTREVIRVYGPAYLLFATITRPYAKAKPRRTTTVTWLIPKDLTAGKMQFCVLAQDTTATKAKQAAPQSKSL